jgi:hypothetical protein
MMSSQGSRPCSMPFRRERLAELELQVVPDRGLASAQTLTLREPARPVTLALLVDDAVLKCCAAPDRKAHRHPTFLHLSTPLHSP